MCTKALPTTLLGLSVLDSTYAFPSGTASSSYASSAAAAGYNTTTTTNSTSPQFPAPFPNISAGPSAESAIESAALGTLPSGNAKNLTPSEDSLISLGLTAFNELSEVAFFTELINNITADKPGYDNVANKEQVLRVLKVVQAQEELHELNANGAFQAFTGNTIEPCAYDFRVDTFEDAISLASRFTDIVLGTLPDIQTVFAQQNDSGSIRGVGSVIGQEGEQNGFYHQILGEVPSQLPFLTSDARDFAFNNFVVPGSCPNVDLLIASQNGKGFGLRKIDTLTLDTAESELSTAADSTAHFSVSTTNTGLGNSFLERTPSNNSGMWLTYMNQQNSPFSIKIDEMTGEAGPLKFSASFPGKTHDLNGLTIAAVTRSDFTGKMMSPDDVAADALFGPALIENNQKIAD